LFPSFPVPQRYYLPSRLRAALQPRLESAGLWVIANDSGTSETSEQPFQSLGAQLRIKASQARATRDTLISTAFAREKVIERARASFDLLTPLILASPSQFFFPSSGEQPTTLDITLAAQLLVLVRAPLPSNPIHELLKDSYPALLEHGQAVMEAAFPRDGPAPMVGVMGSTGVARTLARTVGRIVGLYTDEDTGVVTESTLRERIAYTWVGLAGLGTVAYLLGTIMIHGITMEEAGQEEGSSPANLNVTTEVEEALN
jgi:sorting and assembly machinery component 37